MTEFYVGSLPKAPSGIASKLQVVIAVLFAAATTCAIGFAAVQQTYSRSFFESGKIRTFYGIIEASSYQTILSSPDAADSSALRYLLVAKGKHGADRQLAPYVGKTLRLRGTVIYRDEHKMVLRSAGAIAAF